MQKWSPQGTGCARADVRRDPEEPTLSSAEPEAARPGDRVSDQDRERAPTTLSEHTAAGRRTLDEHEERAELALRATTTADLGHVLRDLPEPSPDSQPARTGSSLSRTARWLVSVMGSSDRRARLGLEGQLNVVTVMGGCSIDLRNAEIIGQEVTVVALALMGGSRSTSPTASR